MNKLKRSLLDFVLTGALAFSGYKGMLTIGGFQPIERSKSAYRELTDCYGSIKELEKMDKVVETMVHSDLKQGIISGDIGDAYHNFFKTNSKIK